MAELITTVAAAVGIAACVRADRSPSADDTRLSAVRRLPSPPESTLSDDAYGGSVRRGRALLAATPDSLPRNARSALRCNSCHLDEGTRAFAMPYVGVFARYPQFRARRSSVELLEDRVNDCFARSLNGRALEPAGPDMRDIVAYLAWISRGVAIGQRVDGQGSTRFVLRSKATRPAARACMS